MTHHRASPAVSIASLRAGYGAADVLKGVSFRLGRGEVFVRLGRNGTGKSTPIRALAGALRPSGGELR